MRRLILLPLLFAVSGLLVFAQSSTTAKSQAQPAPAKSKAKAETDTQDTPSMLGNPPTVSKPKEKEKPAEIPAWLTDLVHKNFGDDVEVFSGDPTVYFTGDFDGDGVEDIAVIVRTQHPDAHAIDLNYKVINPEGEYYGGFLAKHMSTGDMVRWQERRLIAVIHGAGEKSWKADAPKAKYMMIDLPFTRLYVAKQKYKKKVITVLSMDSDTVASMVYWNGKKYRYEPIGTSAN